ncbi:Glycoside hydrolase, family 1 [Corchorus olitorius]|uniref:Glycoside hydrolase, family 1 n=1 Tax=Corchorus olitorius TaxID=93759 RepID=A0A1R3KZY7_9ROSI|nr:Glycoside hydrolase, family 1 [Corchorus olitorius]
MAKQSVFLFCCLLAIVLRPAFSQTVQPKQYNNFTRSLFPNDFLFGAGVSAYQVEGAALEDGKGMSVWDNYVRKYNDRILDHSTGDVASDFYHKYKEDIVLMKKIGLDSFRFSISWSRILPKGRVSEGVNDLGVKFYNDLIDELIKNGIKPFVTLLHFDHPQAIEEEYGAFASRKDDFAEYAEFCFKTFGDRVKYWATLNEPNGWIVTLLPGFGWAEQGGNATESGPFPLGHHLILAHAAAAKIYVDKYQPTQKGKIGITLNTTWYKPLNATKEQEEAADRALDFIFGWFVEPLIYGEYPKSMRDFLGEKLPRFTADETKMIKGSIDFLGVNYYSSSYASYVPFNPNNTANYLNYANVATSTEKDGVPIGTPTPVSWLFLFPKGLEELMLKIKEKYNNPLVYINENGVAEANNRSLSIPEAIKDSLRITALDSHLKFLLSAIE